MRDLTAVLLKLSYFELRTRIFVRLSVLMLFSDDVNYESPQYVFLNILPFLSPLDPNTYFFISFVLNTLKL
jgi:hypothetical protein